MQYQKISKWVIASWLMWPLSSYASFIETTIGTAIVNDATASYFNPAALTLLKNPQIIPLETVSVFRTEFSGTTTATSTGFTQMGSSSSTSYYNSPALYLGLPINDRITIGLASVMNYANRNPEENGILRYIQASNTIQDYDLVPAIGVKINDYLSLGAGINYSYTNFNLHPIVGFPGSNIPDSESTNHSDGSGFGASFGFLLKPKLGTLVGFDYRSVTTYNESGSSQLSGATTSVSNNYHFTLRIPAHTTLSASQMITPTFGLIATVQRIQFSIIRNMTIYNIAANNGGTPVIINASIPYHLSDAWMYTLGGNYRFSPNWVLRIAGTYNKTPDNGHYQLSTGNSYILGASVGHKITNAVSIDLGYANAFIQNEPIHIFGKPFIINGTNQASRDVASLKLTLNV